MKTIIEASLLKHGAATKAEVKKECCSLWLTVDESINALGFFYIENMGANRTNAAKVFEVDGKRCAMAIFSEKKKIKQQEVSELLCDSILQIEKEMAKGN